MSDVCRQSVSNDYRTKDAFAQLATKYLLHAARGFCIDPDLSVCETGAVGELVVQDLVVQASLPDAAFECSSAGQEFIRRTSAGQTLVLLRRVS